MQNTSQAAVTHKETLESAQTNVKNKVLRLSQLGRSFLCTQNIYNLSDTRNSGTIRPYARQLSHTTVAVQCMIKI